MDIPTNELTQAAPDGQPLVSRYDDFLRITKETDTPEMFQIWLLAAYTLMKPAAGNA